MPPIPSTIKALTTRLTALSDQNKGIQQLVQRLAKLDFQPGSQPFESDEGDIRLELSAEIHETLKSIEEELELLRQEVEDFLGYTTPTASTFGARYESNRRDRTKESSKESEKSRVAVLLARLTEDLKSSRSEFRKAQLTAKHNADRAKLKERELLFSNLQSGSSTPSSSYRRKNNPQSTEGEIVAQASSDVTGALRRTHQLMQQELSKSRFAQETLEQSSAALADLGENYSDLNSLLSTSKALVTTLVKSEKSDTWYLETTLYILITTVLWLIFRRWLYGPISWFLVFPLKIVFRILFAIVPIGASSTAVSSLATSSQTSTSLIVKPSASGGIPKRPIVQDRPRNYVPVGAGGRGYAQDPSPPQSLSQSVGQMAEQGAQTSEHKEQVIRGDGTVLPDREHPPNPKKKMMEEPEQQHEEPIVRGDGTVLVERAQPPNPKKKVWDESVEGANHESAQKQEEQKAPERDEL